jgi:cytochrome c oxidase subunit 1
VTPVTITAALRRLPAGDRTLLLSLTAAALFALVVGVVLGAMTGLARAGLLGFDDPETGYRLMTLHGSTIFFYWLYFGQAALLLVLTAVYARDTPRLALAPAGWAGVLLMLGGLAANQTGTWLGTPLLYDGSPELVADYARPMAGVFYLGYLMLAGGLFLIAVCAIATAIAGKIERGGEPWGTIVFGAVGWAGLVMVSALALVNAFLPAAAWAFGLGAPPVEHQTAWHLLFHNLHYLPLMGTVLAWYALVRDMTGVRSIFGDRFSKAMFTLYLIFVPPTSLYHMFLEPGLAPLLRTLGSLLSLFISVPTVAVFLVIVASLEAHARANGARGLFGWLGVLPWREPAMTAIGWAVVNLALGGTLAFVLIQEQLAGLLSDTFFVPGYFHFLTVGTVSLSLLAVLAWIIPPLVGREIAAPRLLRALPAVITAGLALFGFAGVAAGLAGMPRRVIDASYGGEAPAAWGIYSGVIGTGASVMAFGLLAYAGGLGWSLVYRRRVMRQQAATVALTAPSGAVFQRAVLTGPLSVALLVAAMYGATMLAFGVMQALPVVIGGGAGH